MSVLISDHFSFVYIYRSGLILKLVGFLGQANRLVMYKTMSSITDIMHAYALYIHTGMYVLSEVIYVAKEFKNRVRIHAIKRT